MTIKDSKHFGKRRSYLRLIRNLDQPHAPFFDVRPYLPGGDDLKLLEKAGFLMEPFVIMEGLIKVITKKNELVVMQVLLRFTLGFHRSTCPASYSFIAEWTGLDPQNVRTAVKSLLAMGVVRVVRPGIPNVAAEYELPIVKGYLDWVEAQRQLLLKSTTSDAEHMVKSTTPYGSSHHDNMVAATIKKENPNKNQNIPSQQAPGEIELELYISNVKPNRKQEGERFFLQQLRTEYSASDILLALRYLQTHGVLGTQAPCHSPMAYLARAAEQVVTLAKSEAAKRQARDYAAQAAADRAHQEQEQEAAEDSVHRVALEQFQQTFTVTEQDHQIDAFLNAKYPGSSFQLPRSVVLRFVARQWWDEQTSLRATEEQQ